MNEIKAFEMSEAAEAARRQWRALGEVVAIVAAPLRLELDDLRQRLNSAQAERDALAARLAAIEAALAPALAALSGATAGKWGYCASDRHQPVLAWGMRAAAAPGEQAANARAIVAAVNAVRAVADIGEEPTS